MEKFELHQNFNDKINLGNLKSGTLLLNNIVEIDWYILVFKRINAKNITDLSQQENLCFWKDINEISFEIKKIYNPSQINIAMFSNITQQLHCHIMPRFEDDIAWPNPIFSIHTTKKIELSSLAISLKNKIFESK